MGHPSVGQGYQSTKSHRGLCLKEVGFWALKPLIDLAHLGGGEQGAHRTIQAPLLNLGPCFPARESRYGKAEKVGESLLSQAQRTALPARRWSRTGDSHSSPLAVPPQVVHRIQVRVRVADLSCDRARSRMKDKRNIIGERLPQEAGDGAPGSLWETKKACDDSWCGLLFGSCFQVRVWMVHSRRNIPSCKALARASPVVLHSGGSAGG